MDARERLRRYLEQRRETGESELILDGLPVDDVMAMLSTRPVSPRPRTPHADAPAPAATGAGEGAGAAPTPKVSSDKTSTLPSATGLSDTASTSAAADTPPGAGLPPHVEPRRRFDADSSTDWRETLRRAGAMRPDSNPGSTADVEPDAEIPLGQTSDTPADGPQPSTPLDAAPSDSTGGYPEWLAALGLPRGLSAGRSGIGALEPAIGALPTLAAIAEMVRACTRCDLYRTAINPVPGEGNPNADFVCVGEAPGQSEDEKGRPFVGPAGSLLNKILGAIQLQREDVFICNVLKHRPPGNRDPLPEEVRACEPYLRRQLELIRPRVILALGRFAAGSLLGTTTPIGKLRGQVHRYHGIPLIVTYHPAALLRNESWKRPTWDDVKLARRILDASRAASAP